jgi:hypothetical protein
VAQTRLAKVMLTNSVVLKEESDWIEYYYRRVFVIVCVGMRWGFCAFCVCVGEVCVGVRRATG